MQWLRRLFGQKNSQPSHKEIEEKAKRIQEGTDMSSRIVHDEKNKFNVHLLKMSKKAKIVLKKAQKTEQVVDTALSIAVATGSLRL